MARLPGGCTVPSRTGSVAVPASTELRATNSSPGASGGASTGMLSGGSASTGPSFSRAPPNSVHAPGSGVHARISRSMAAAGRPQSTCASSGVTLGA